MWHSLFQSAMRQDIGYYALIAAVRPDQNSCLVCYPYYTKMAIPGDDTGFLHIDLNVPRLLETGRGAQIVQTTVAVDDETEDGCTLLIPGFFRHIKEWWRRVEQRGLDKGGYVTKISQKTLTKEDRSEFGDFEPFPCRRGDVRITRPEIPHGSTEGAPQIRRTLFPWFTGVQPDMETLDNAESDSWSQLAVSYRDLEAPPAFRPIRHGQSLWTAFLPLPGSSRIPSD